MAPIRYCGRNSLFIYVAFSFPMVASRIIGSKLGIFANTDMLAAFVMLSAVTGALMMAWLARKTPIAFLFDRPGWARWPARAKTEQQPELIAAGARS